ncbi:hypothetical protein HZS61_004557 [Fusarium oxysporum f. sp. conglutinans]|uniref:ABC transporter domain-containing protein n=1 Tax=Fusarium oxysporum f. sp. conglutinans TaxID=100902 RepID=A0A8H6GDT7_FUSOX|nr:hypothetical protein HZS61_004557 [Fusarium oxysporum f. sp. conglutinans]
MLNPSSPSFDFQAWSRTLVKLRSQLKVPTPPRSGFAFKSLTVRGSSAAIEKQGTVWTMLTFPLDPRAWFPPKQTKTILQGLDGLVHKGELLLVLGRPGSGCSTFLKTITGQMRDLDIDSASILQYTGVPHRIMTRQFKGELIYNGEVDENLPYLTVGQTLEFAAAMRTPRARLPGITRKDRVKHVVQVMLTVFGLSHTKNTIVGNDYVRGVSGGERKRVSIAETALSEAAISAWDNSTRGLDAESALHFVSRLRTLSDLTQSSNAAAIYQSSQSIFDLFDKILVLYEGREIFFGPASSAPDYFERMGWQRHARQTSGDYLTTITDPEQRIAKEGHEDSVPRTPEDFSRHWLNSTEYARLMEEIDKYQKDFDLQQETTRKQFESIRHNLKAKGMLRRATQTVSFPMQTALCVKRATQQLWNDKGSTFTTLIGEIIIALVVGSIFYGADVLVFLHDRIPGLTTKADSKLKGKADVEQPLVVNSTPVQVVVNKGTAPQADQGVFAWRKLTYDVMIKGESRRLLNDACGWVKPGSMIALMGVSGAGKTTLLNALAQRMPAGDVKGEFYVNGKPLPESFKSDVGYVQQQDVHLETSTVREALQFSAMLRQSRDIPIRQKLEFAEETIHLLGMDDFADAIVGLPGKGLNAEQRKRLSIGVELAGKPSLLLFLDEPTSGLDSQSSEAILALLKKLAASGLGILCTIHQPSAMLFQRFDRLLLMARGGKVAYFGDIGNSSEAVLRYFDARAPRRCKDAENPAEYILGMIGNTDGQGIDWPGLWDRSTEANVVSTELERISKSSSQTTSPESDLGQGRTHGTYRIPLSSQLPIVCRRIFQQYWRSTTYIASKFILGIAGTLFIGFSFFQPGQSILGVQNAIFSILMVCAMFSSLVQQIMPKFIMQRTVYEVREKHSNMYSWVALIFANILVEIPYHLVLGIITFAIFNYTVFGIRSPEDQGLALLFFTYFYVLVGTFAVMVTAPLPDATTAGRITTVLFSMMILFAGVFQTPTALPGFWIFMYRVSPMTYLVGGVSVSGLSGDPVVCSQSELAVFQPPAGDTCGSYMQPYLEQGATGTLLNPSAAANCSYCPLQYADQILARSGMYYQDRWRDWAFGFAYIAFNILATFVLYSLLRLGLLGSGFNKVKQLFRRKKAAQ